jgi:hypothetical protein
MGWKPRSPSPRLNAPRIACHIRISRAVSRKHCRSRQGALPQRNLAAAPKIGPYPLAVSLGSALLAAGSLGSLEQLLAEADADVRDQTRAQGERLK